MTAAERFTQLGDCAFGRVAACFPDAARARLALDQPLPPARYQALHDAVSRFVAGSLGLDAVPPPDSLLDLLAASRDRLPNYSPGALLEPKRELVLEFNQIHRHIADIFADHPLDDLIDGIDLPVNVRVVYGQSPRTDDQPFTSTKLHSDVWAGVPGDACVMVIPVLGDIDNLTIELGEMDPALERAWMRTLSSYDEGAEVEIVRPYPTRMELGHLYMADCRLLHQTVRRRRSGVRVSIDFRFRMNDPDYRALLLPSDPGGPDSADVRVPYPLWKRVGRDHLMVFDETLEQARARRHERVVAEFYGQRYRLVSLFPEDA